MQDRRFKVLLIIEQCNPEWASVPLVGYRYYEGISQLAETTLVTHNRNQSALEKAHPDREIVYIAESSSIRQYYKLAERLSKVKGKTIWPLYNTLSFPVYDEFNRQVYQKFRDRVLSGEFDVVHAITPMMPRYPVKLIEACDRTPFVLGPVNGGVPFPPGFKAVSRQEFAYFNFLRTIGRHVIPGYRETYEKADRILAGSTYTLNLIQDLFDVPDDRISLAYENGITQDFLKGQEELAQPKIDADVVRLLFVGRLVPYKGADMLIDAIGQLDLAIQQKVELSIVGDGSERSALEAQVNALNLSDRIHFTGWVQQQETLDYYRTSDVFCFPSIREFGGAVVIEAMASGLPCIVVNNGGIGEYVTEKTGFKIEPVSRSHVVEDLKKHITMLIENPALRQQMAVHAIDRAKAFTWETKVKEIVAMYGKIVPPAQVAHLNVR
ncbi:glycosyltransferase family 4 protein [Microcoleus sp. FACHB-1515]|uniref:glycosyltransferase family 4 protein n=1 Tax=Cyanophyceae TaxID=3028117 RepID=UPI0016888109|nr:glycosyltransferase family 4 protein [Microcoleus sp. FACHB-1515]MBD2088934.1 glycosyltransferase family 4 protein [Microcoleus sp. FACHB-1515]